MKDAAPTSRWSGVPIIGQLVRIFCGNEGTSGSSGRLPSPEVKTYHCGTLTYTKAGLVAIFAWLLWGDFCFTIMETVAPSVLPLKLKALGSPNWLMGLILSTVPNILNMAVNPVVSFKSDRYRSRWGRRIPFIAWTLPFLCLSMVLFGCSDGISAFLRVHLFFLRNVAPTTVTIALIGVFMATFQFFNMFVGSVFYYLFNDVVPAQFLARFTALFQIVGTAAAALYQYFVFQYAETNMREIFVGAALVYFVGFTIVCVMVKEGEYPPVEGENDTSPRGLQGVKTFLNECFREKWYWLFFIWSSLGGIASATGIFGIFFYKEMGLSLEDIGKLAAIGAIVSVPAFYLASVFIDRWNPMRVRVYFGIFVVIWKLTNWVWIFVTLSGKCFFWLALGTSMIEAFFWALYSVCGYPLLTRVFPKSRFGQFCSANAMLGSLVLLVGGVAAGSFIDGIAWLYRNSGSGPYFVYRFNFLWTAFFMAVGGALGVWVYVYWHRLGGEQGYKPPAPWSPRKTEDLDPIATVGPQFRWLSLSLRVFDAIMWLSVLSLPALIWWMHQRGAAIAARGYVLLLLPLSLAVLIGWQFLERGIRRDMARSLRNEPLHNGIPHHGVLMAVSVQYLLAFGIWVAEILVTVKLNMERECIIFGIANVATNLLLTAAMWVIWRMERGRSGRLDTNA